MRIDQDVRESRRDSRSSQTASDPPRGADGEMGSINDETDLETSPAAEVNRPPVGTHDVDGQIGDVDLEIEYPRADD